MSEVNICRSQIPERLMISFIIIVSSPRIASNTILIFSSEVSYSLVFRANKKHTMERWTEVVQSVNKGMLFYSGGAGHFVHCDDPELLISSIKIVLNDLNY